jgi:inorganic triphosphatase YgiF
MGNEVELKLALDEAHQARFLRHPLLRRATARHTETLDNIYYDTGDLSLRRHGIALRLRRQGKLWLQTVKLAGTAAAGLSSRPEWETPYRGHFDFSAIEHGRTARLAGTAPAACAYRAGLRDTLSPQHLAVAGHRAAQCC